MASNNFGHTASSRVINDGTTSFAQCGSGKNILISEKTIRVLTYSLMTAHGVDCFPKAAHSGILDSCIIHCLSPKSTSWSNLESTSASAYRIATNQKFNFSLMIMNGMLGHISNGTPFLMYPRFIQLFLNKQLEGVARPQDFIPSVTLPSKIFTFMRKHSPKFSCRITPLTSPMLEVVTTLAAEEEQSTSPHSRAASSARDAQGTPTHSAAQASLSPAQDTANVQGTATSQRTADVQGTADFQDMAEPHGAANIPKSPNDYTPQIVRLKKIWGDEGLLDLYALNREVRRLKKQTLSQAKLIRKLKAKLKNLSKVVAPVVKHHAFWVESQHLAKQKRRRKKQKKKMALETSNDGEVAKKVSREWDAEVEKEKVGRIEREQAKVGDLTTIWETPETSDDNFWKNQEDWEIISYPLLRVDDKVDGSWNGS
ncbi:hypothetical protein Tco_1105659 [Tanacetum coccineum]